MSTVALGRLERVDVREAWQSEPGDFTPWLAREENLAILADTLGLRLACEAQEKSVGPFRADILCRDEDSGNWVLIENQLERTDHTHLGQLLTYAAGLQAATIVWIAESFTEEHRAALDWLNEVTGDRFHFFGVQIELWRIGESSLAPKFNVVSKPNDWSKAVSQGVERLEGNDKGKINPLRTEYWAAFAKYMLEHKSQLRPPKPVPWTNVGFPIGRSGTHLWTYANEKEQCIGVGLTCGGDEGKALFHELVKQRPAVDQAIPGLNWEELPDNKHSLVTVYKQGADIAARDSWPDQHSWLLETLSAFRNAFAPRIKQISLDSAADGH